MNERLTEVLGESYRAEEWKRTPVKEWHNFTVQDMYERGFYTRVWDWFNKLSDKQIREIYNDGNGIKGCRKSTYQYVNELSY